ncbi:MAG: HAD family hydrolase, partial [Nitrososphaeria archaeon]
MISAAIFDLDGVIVDSEPLHYLSEKDMLSKRGVNLRRSDTKDIVGRTEMESMQYLKDRFGLKDSAKHLYEEKQRIYKRMLRNAVKPRPGLFKLLNDLEDKGMTLAIASSAPRENIDIVLKALEIEDKFRAVVSGEDVERGKPSPDIFLLAAQRIGIGAKNCLVIEDAQNGVEAAKRAGMTCI